MDRQEVIARAQELGIEFSKKSKTVDIAKKIETVTGDKIVITKPAPKPAPPPETEYEERKSTEETIRAIVYSGDRDNDEVSFFVAINGDTCQAPIGVEVDLPVKFLPVLHDASFVEHIHEIDEDGNPTGRKAKRIKKRYIVEKL